MSVGPPPPRASSQVRDAVAARRHPAARSATLP
jgi:hypothetical protein